MTQTQEKELVIFLDLNDQGLTGNSSKTELREAALNVIRSLAPNVKVLIGRCGLLIRQSLISQ